MRGILTKVGETFDRLTGRSWKPSSNLATSELVERLKTLLDSEVEDLGAKGRFVPHNIKLKMQWDKFSTDSEVSLNSLETELLTAAIDHINDNLYHTHAPLRIEVKPDYFTEGVKLLVSFDKFAEDAREAELNVSIPDLKIADSSLQNAEEVYGEDFTARFTLNQIPRELKIKFGKDRRLSVGRTKENDLTIDDASVSKIHASLVLNGENQLLVADTGSTNGTFIGGERIAYGKAYPVAVGEIVKFGTIEVSFEHLPKPTEILTAESDAAENSVEINGFEFRQKTQTAPESEIDVHSCRTKAEIPPIIQSQSNDAEVIETEQKSVSDFETEKDIRR